MNCPRVLCVDDNARFLGTLKTALEYYGCEATTACDGLDALKQFETHGVEFDAVVTDHEMPRMDGRKFVHSLRALGFKGPIVVMSGNFQEGDSEAYSSQGISHFLQKPFELKSLLTVLLKKPVEIQGQSRSL